MTFKFLALLAFTLLTASACVVEPIGERRAYYHDDDHGHDYGHRAWHR